MLGADGSFEKVTERVETLLGVKFWKQGVQHVARVAAADVQSFYEARPVPAAKSEDELLVSTIDGKGVPMRPDEPRRSRLRVGPGEKPNKKKEAVVSAVYTTVQELQRFGREVLVVVAVTAVELVRPHRPVVEAELLLMKVRSEPIDAAAQSTALVVRLAVEAVNAIKTAPVSAVRNVLQSALIGWSIRRSEVRSPAS